MTHPIALDSTRPLRLALRANAAFSTTCALLFVLDRSALSPLLGVPAPWLLVLGLGLLGFAAMLVVTSRRSDPSRLAAEARVHCAADWAWVVGSVPVVVLGLLAPLGAFGLVGVSTVVAALAWAQGRGLRALRTSAGA